jgi:hypothetical protein
MKFTWEHYGLLQILQTRLFHSARWLGWLSAPLCSTIMVKFYEKLWLLKKITNYWHLKFFLLIAPKRGWHLCNSRMCVSTWVNDHQCLFTSDLILNARVRNVLPFCLIRNLLFIVGCSMLFLYCSDFKWNTGFSFSWKSQYFAGIYM